ncbi:MAG: hypothetical protein AB7F43_06125 [Bacteriovoracia bacterium]
MVRIVRILVVFFGIILSNLAFSDQGGIEADKCAANTKPDMPYSEFTKIIDKLDDQLAWSWETAYKSTFGSHVVLAPDNPNKIDLLARAVIYFAQYFHKEMTKEQIDYAVGMVRGAAKLSDTPKQAFDLEMYCYRIVVERLAHKKDCPGGIVSTLFDQLVSFEIPRVVEGIKESQTDRVDVFSVFQGFVNYVPESKKIFYMLMLEQVARVDGLETLEKVYAPDFNKSVVRAVKWRVQWIQESLMFEFLSSKKSKRTRSLVEHLSKRAPTRALRKKYAQLLKTFMPGGYYERREVADYLSRIKELDEAGGFVFLSDILKELDTTKEIVQSSLSMVSDKLEIKTFGNKDIVRRKRI